MKLFRTILIGLSALIAVGCGGDSVQSPDFTPVLKALTIEPLTATAPAGRTTQFQAIGEYTLPPDSKPATEKRAIASGVTWTVSNANASIDANGLATGLLEGETVIGASIDGLSATATLETTPAVLDSIAIDPDPANVSLGNDQVFTANGTYSDGSTAPVDVTWSSSAPGVATVSPGPGTSTTAESVSEGTTTITAVAVDDEAIEDTATLTVGPFQPTLMSVLVAPDPATQPAGRSEQFTVTGTCTADPFSGATAPCTPTGVVWSVANSAVAMIDASSGVATGVAVGSTQVTATSGAVSDSAVFNVTEAVLDSIIVNPSNPTVALGSTQAFTATGVFSNGTTTNIVVDWSSSDTSVATVSPTADSGETTATTLSQGTTDIVATTTNDLGETITGDTELTVSAATLTTLLRVETAAGDTTGRTTVGRAIEFVAIGQYSDGTEQVIDDANITWASSDTGVATIAANGFASGLSEGQTTITATRVDVPTQNASTTLTVTGQVCTTPLLDSEGATVQENISMLCLGCTVDNEGNIINPNTEDFATITVPVGVQGGSAGVTVAPAASGAPYTVPFAAGNNVGFIVGKPAGTLVTAELFSQIFVSTLLDGAVQETTSGGVIPLRVDLLGQQLAGAVDTALVSFATSVPYDAIQVSFNSGTATALSTIQVYQACATADIPPPPVALERIARIEPAATSISVDATKNFIAIGEYSDGSESPIADADLDWSSDSESVATVDALGLVTGVGAGQTAIRATLKAGVGPNATLGERTAQSTVTVVANVCTAPLLASEGATVSSHVSGLLDVPPALCLLCSVSNTANIIDAPITNFGTISVPLGLLNATASVTVSSNAETAINNGGIAGFVIARPTGVVLEAELASQIQVSTLLDGVVQETTGPTIPLRADLLGMSVVGGIGDTALVTIDTTLPYDAVRLTFVSGVVTAGLLQNNLQTVNVLQACTTATPPPAP